VNEGDSYVINSLQDVKNLLENYAGNVNAISSLLDNIITRLTTIADPTPKNKLKVISMPSTKELNISINEKINQLIKIKRELINRVKEIENNLNESKVICNRCKGTGRIPKIEYIREEDIVMPITKYEKCPKCNGLGYFIISERVVSIGKTSLESIKRLYAR